MIPLRRARKFSRALKPVLARHIETSPNDASIQMEETHFGFERVSEHVKQQKGKSFIITHS